jgi:antitoxin CptB
MASPLDPKALGRLKWRCRRGLLENDLLLERFFARHGDALTSSQAIALEALVALPDNDLLDLLLARQEPHGDLDRPAVRDLLALLRRPTLDPPPPEGHP